MACRTEFDDAEDERRHNAEAAQLLCWLLQNNPMLLASSTPLESETQKLLRWWNLHQHQDKATVEARLSKAKRIGYIEYLGVLESLTEYERNLVFGPA